MSGPARCSAGVTVERLPASQEWPFDRIVCGIDGSEEAAAAAAQGLRLAPAAAATLVYVVDPMHLRASRLDLVSWVQARREAGVVLLEDLRRRLGPAGSAAGASVEEGRVEAVLREKAGDSARPLVTIGYGDDAERQLRYSGPPPTGERLALRIIRAVRSSVLVARRPPRGDNFPRSVLVGVDGSAPSLYAYRVAAQVAEASGGRLRTVVALGGRGADLRALTLADPAITADVMTDSTPERALLGAAGDSDLVVVGDRGLGGRPAPGSVTNRIVTGSPTSVLVVHAPAEQCEAVGGF